LGIVEESHAGRELYPSGREYEKPVSWIVTGRGRGVFCAGADHTPSPTLSTGLDISSEFMATAVWGRGGRSLRNLLFRWKAKDGACM
jgi:hypothetical protein